MSGFICSPSQDVGSSPTTPLPFTRNKKLKTKDKIVKLPPPTVCDYCGGKVEFVNNEVIYHKPYGKWPFIYLCHSCGAKVGCHKETRIPLGTLANDSLRKKRMDVHNAFDHLWKSKIVSRTNAYVMLRERLGITANECHIGQFTFEMCEKALLAIEIINNRVIFFKNNSNSR